VGGRAWGEALEQGQERVGQEAGARGEDVAVAAAGLLADEKAQRVDQVERVFARVMATYSSRRSSSI
jgi:hypothetical protein